MSTKFPLGLCTMSIGPCKALRSTDPDNGLTELDSLVARHAAGDWGELDEPTKEMNNKALKDSGRLYSIYTLSKGLKVWMITEEDRSVTTVMLPEEF